MARSEYKLQYQHRRMFNICNLLFLAKHTPLQNDPAFQKRYRRLLNKKSFAIYKKGSQIRDVLIDKTAVMHDGMFPQRLVISPNMVNFKFGQYVYTKRMGAYIHKDNKLAKKRAKALKQAYLKSKQKQKPQKKKKKII